MRSYKYHFLIGALFFAVSAVHYRSLFTAWFLADEISHVAAVINMSPWEILTYPGDPAGNFVPMLDLSLRLDWVLFGLSPIGYHVHSCVAAVVAAAFLVIMARRWCTQSMSLYVGLVFLLLQPTVAVTSWICTRHYVEGTVFCLLSGLLVLQYRDSPARWWMLPIAGFLYLAACLAKEIFTMMPLALLFLPSLKRRHRLLLLGHFAAFGMVYIVWRAAVTGAVLNRYGVDQLSAKAVWRYFCAAWPQFTSWMLGDPSAKSYLGFFIVNSLLVAGLCAAWLRSGRHVLTLVALLVGAIVPSALVMGTAAVDFLGVRSHYCMRFLYLPCAVIVVSGVWAVAKLPRRVARPLLLVLGLFVAYYGRLQVRPWIRDGGITQRSAEVYHKWFDSRALIVTDVPMQLHSGLSEIWFSTENRETLAKVYPAAPRVIARDEPYLQTEGVSFVEDLRTGTTVMDKFAFIRKYGNPQ